MTIYKPTDDCLRVQHSSQVWNDKSQSERFADAVAQLPHTLQHLTTPAGHRCCKPLFNMVTIQCTALQQRTQGTPLTTHEQAARTATVPAMTKPMFSDHSQVWDDDSKAQRFADAAAQLPLLLQHLATPAGHCLLDSLLQQVHAVAKP
jgi:hypothetical protein